MLAYAQHIDDLTPIVPVVEHIAQKHASLHILPSQYSIVATSLLSAIRELVGADTFSGALYDAWYAAYWNLAHIFIKRERELYDAAGWEGWREFVLARKTQETEDVTSFYFKPKDGKPLAPHRAGQFLTVWLYVPELGYKQPRKYVPLICLWICYIHCFSSGIRSRMCQARITTAPPSDGSPVPRLVIQELYLTYFTTR